MSHKCSLWIIKPLGTGPVDISTGPANEARREKSVSILKNLLKNKIYSDIKPAPHNNLVIFLIFHFGLIFEF
jgi:hypothetical protein